MKLAVVAIAVFSTVSAQEANPLSQQKQVFKEEPRELRAEAIDPVSAASLVTSSWTIAQSVIPLIGSNKKGCHQLACWVGAKTKECAWVGANQAQRELMRGRNSFSVESENEFGMWVRYWRTQFWPPDSGDIATGNCTDGASFAVTNCMGTGKVYC